MKIFWKMKAIKIISNLKNIKNNISTIKSIILN